MTNTRLMRCACISFSEPITTHSVLSHWLRFLRLSFLLHFRGVVILSFFDVSVDSNALMPLKDLIFISSTWSIFNANVKRPFSEENEENWESDCWLIGACDDNDIDARQQVEPNSIVIRLLFANIYLWYSGQSLPTIACETHSYVVEVKK